MLDGMPGLNNREAKLWRKGVLTGLFILIPVLLGISLWFSLSSPTPREAPESERVLHAQVELPFQVLIPAYLPKQFKREKVEIITDQSGPNGEKMVKLIYATRKGETLTLSEWLPADQDAARTVSNIRRCLCLCRAAGQCNMAGMELNVGPVQIRVEYSTPNLLDFDQLQLVLDTLGPAANRQVYSAIADVPLSFSVPPPVEIPVGADGVQEITLIVAPEGYSPVHFAVKKNVPVRLIFRQLGQVGCGNELIFQWGARQGARLILASAADKQVLEFTPGEAGEFRFSCPHLIYRGVMTVTD
jgi:hypothetical protein